MGRGDRLFEGTIWQRRCAGAINEVDGRIDALPVFAEGSYTPTLNNTTNVDGSTAAVTYYSRVGSTVTVWGVLDIDPTASGASTVLGISIPVASDFTSSTQLSGTAAGVSVIEAGGISADATNNRATLVFVSATTGNHTLRFHFSYRIL